MMKSLVEQPNRRKLEYDKKLKQIESDEMRLKVLEQELIVLQMRLAEEASPLIDEFCGIRFENLSRLKLHLADSFFKKKEKRLIAHLIIELAIGLQKMGDLRAEAILEEHLDEDDLINDEKDDDFNSQEFFHSPFVEKKEEGKLEIKTLFRQLAKVFHPDKELQEHLKEEKTDLMKKITAAYENQDLYSLLKLEKEQLGPRELSEDKLKLYIKHINDRLKELKSFEAMLKKHGPLSSVYQLIYSRKVTVQEYNIKNELLKIEEEVRQEKVLQQIMWDSTTLRQYLKS